MEFLNRGEKIYLKFRTSRLYPNLLKFFLSGLCMLLLTFIILISGFSEVGILTKQDISLTTLALGIALLAVCEIKRAKMGTYYITNYRIVISKGIVSSKMDSISYALMANVKSSQSMIERVFRLGNLEIATITGQQTVIDGIKQPKRVENFLYEMLESNGRRNRQ